MASDTDLVTLIQGFRLFCLAEGKQRTTIRWYTGKLNIFLRYLRSHDLPVNATELTATHLRAFLVHLRDNAKTDENNPMKPARSRELSPKTIQGYARTLRAFFSWLAREGYISENAGKLLKIPKAPKVIITTLSDQQVKRLMSVVDRRSARGFRDYCILLTLLDTGIRLSELVNLERRDLDMERGFLTALCGVQAAAYSSCCMVTASA